VFEEGIDLSELDLQRIILREAILEHARFEQAVLWGAHLEEANLSFAHFESSQLHFAFLNGAILWFTEFSPDSKLEHVHWGNYTFGEEKDGNFAAAEITYRRLKQWHTNAGMYDSAGEFFFREMTAKRKMLKWLPNPFPRVWSKLISLICGYGERPFRVIASAVVVVFGLALIYFAIGTLTPNTFLNSLYYSAVSFTALGYGQWAPQPAGWVKGLGAFEAFMGVFMMALFLITFVRKMTR